MTSKTAFSKFSIVLAARNTLTQRTIGPESSGVTAVDISNLKDGDFAGLALLQRQYGLVGMKSEGGTNFVVMVSAQSNTPVEVARVAVNQKTVFLKAECNFKNRADRARFYYSLDGESWTVTGNELRMSYTLPHDKTQRHRAENLAQHSGREKYRAAVERPESLRYGRLSNMPVVSGAAGGHETLGGVAMGERRDVGGLCL